MRRRDFTAMLVTCAAQVAAAGCVGDEGTRIPGPTRRVIVVGAGIAGLFTARSLVAQGVDVVVVEARDRIGGRAWTVDLAGARVDAGAAWIHGRTKNPAAELCDALGLATRLHDYDYAWLWDAVAARFATNTELAAAVDFESAIFADLADLRRALASTASMQDAIDLYLAGLDLDPTSSRHARFVLEQLLLEVDYGGPARRTSLAIFDEDEFFGYDDHLVSGGFRALSEALAQGLDLRLSTPIARIEWDDGEARTIDDRGNSLAADRVVVTVPLGVLQANAIEFSPPLPQRKAQALSRMEMGSLEKVILRFESRFWGDSDDVAWLHLGSERGEFPLWIDLTRDAGAPTLVSMHGGDRARQQLDTRDDATLVSDAIAVLQQHFAGTIPTPIASHVTRWRSDPWARGSYTFPALGQSMADFDAVAEPIGDRVLFAGEGTSRPYFGTIHGAIDSAARELRRLGFDPFVVGRG